MDKSRRAVAARTRRYSHATLKTADRSLTVMVKLLNNGHIAIGVYPKGDRPVHRQLSPDVKWGD